MRNTGVVVAGLVIILPIGVVGLQEVSMEDARQTARYQVKALQKELQTALAQRTEARLRAHGAVIVSKLNGGEIHKREIRIERGGTVFVLGGCDEGCSDLDLAIFDPEGRELEKDNAPDDLPYLRFAPTITGIYQNTTVMHECQAQPCFFAQQVLQGDFSLEDIEYQATGTGFLIGPNGSILTAYHVVEGASSIKVTLPDGTQFPATLERTSSRNDVALISIKARSNAHLSLAEPGKTKVGDRIFTVGYPAPDLLGKEQKFTEGSVTALSGIGGEATQLQISAPIQPGNSGGAVVNEDGQVVAIVTSSAPDLLEEWGAQPQMVNWAVKVDVARALIHDAEVADPARDWEEAIERARSSTVWIEVIGGGE